MGLPPTNAIHDAVEIALGKTLFFDKRLSADGKISCADCHMPSKAFTDGRTVATGIRGLAGNRNTPTLWNVAYQHSLFWDGRSPDLESQVPGPLLNPREHGMRDKTQVVHILENDGPYLKLFTAAFGKDTRPVSFEHMAQALASYERTLLSGGSPFDRYLYGKDIQAMSASAIRGLKLFRGRAQCSSCHLIGEKASLFTDQEFHVAPAGISRAADERLAVMSQRVAELKNASDQDALDKLVSSDRDVASLGRFLVTLEPGDIGKFKTPSLRNVALTAPYMHDGSIKTLPDVIDVELYTRGDLREPIVLTSLEKEDLLAFLEALTSPTANAKTSP